MSTKSFEGRLEILDKEQFYKDPTMLSLLIQGEDHTLGNAMSHALNDMEGVEFAGYNVPHPLEDAIMFRVQTKKGYNAMKVMLQAIDMLECTFESVNTKFSESLEGYRANS
uniref:DNA-directed RNA polymerase RBP11-like dimerisation domain-containing protein n=2 Tax=Panagrolaimus sp. JU765 TaxID=591449 RepID=A0AC34PYK5_9BILA